MTTARLTFKALVLTAATVLGLGVAQTALAHDYYHGGHGHGGFSGLRGHTWYDNYPSYGGFNYGYHRAPQWHDTSHSHYQPGYTWRHGNHYHYEPGRYVWHRTGHWHH